MNTFTFQENLVSAIIEGLMKGGTMCLPLIDAIRSECDKQIKEKQSADKKQKSDKDIKQKK